MTDALDDLVDRHAVGLWHLSAAGVDDVLQFLWHRRRAVHDEMRFRQPLIDRLDHIHGENVTRGFAREFVGAMRSADGDSQCIDPRTCNKIHSLLGVGEQLVFFQLAFEAVAVFLVAGAGLEGTEATELALD